MSVSLRRRTTVVLLLMIMMIGVEAVLHVEALAGKGEDGFHKKDPTVDEDAVFENEDEAKAAMCEACHAVHDTLAGGSPITFADACSQVDFGDTYFFATDKMESACRRFVRDAENMILVISRFLASSTKTAPGSMGELLLERGVDAARLTICKPLCGRVKHEHFAASYEDRWGVIMQRASETVANAQRDEL